MYSKRLDKDGFMLKRGHVKRHRSFHCRMRTEPLGNLSDYEWVRNLYYIFILRTILRDVAQACGFGELYPQLVEKGVEVVGISKDKVYAS